MYSKYIELGANRMCITDDDKLHLRSDRGSDAKARFPTEQCYQVSDRLRPLSKGKLAQLARLRQVSSTTNINNIDSSAVIKTNDGSMTKTSHNNFSNAKYKKQIMEKYLRGLDMDSSDSEPKKCGMELSKWLESTAKFTPEKNNYIEWNCKR